MKRRVPLTLMAGIALASIVGTSASGATRGRNVTFRCNIQTLEHLNCGGGLRAPGAVPPDCKNFVSDRVTDSRFENIIVPSRHLHYMNDRIEFSKPVEFLSSENGGVVYRTYPNLYTDAAGYSVDSGVCSIVSGGAFIRRLRAPKV